MTQEPERTDLIRERVTVDIAALRRRMEVMESISRDDVRLLFALIESEQERHEQQGADLTALWVLAERAVLAWSESPELTASDIPMAALAAALGEDHPGAALFAELQMLRADLLALRRMAQIWKQAVADGHLRTATDSMSVLTQLAQTDRPGAALLAAIQGTIGAWERLVRCNDEFLPEQPEACGEYADLLDSAVLELRRALGGVAGTASGGGTHV